MIFRLIILAGIVTLTSCTWTEQHIGTWYKGPMPMPKENASGDQLSEFYSGPTLPDESVDGGGDLDVTSFDNN